MMHCALHDLLAQGPAAQGSLLHVPLPAFLLCWVLSHPDFPCSAVISSPLSIFLVLYFNNSTQEKHQRFWGGRSCSPFLGKDSGKNAHLEDSGMCCGMGMSPENKSPISIRGRKILTSSVNSERVWTCSGW